MGDKGTWIAFWISISIFASIGIYSTTRPLPMESDFTLCMHYEHNAKLCGRILGTYK